MPTISIFHQDLNALLGETSTIEQVDAWLPLVKGELKDHTFSTGEIRVELQDSNRPDLWCVEGIARQISTKLKGSRPSYPFVRSKARPKRRITVAKGMEVVRPFVAACCSTEYRVTEDGLTQLIQVQEKLSDIYGHKRQTVSIGLYRLSHIQFPVTYGLVKPEEARFTPLGFSDKMSLKEIVEIHPKGLEYGPIVSKHDSYPLLWDKEGQILSFPPIINSREIGEVRVGDGDLLVEVTGTDIRMVLLTLNIFAANLADRGAKIEPVEILYPYATDYGKSVRTPHEISDTQAISLHEIEAALGQPLGKEAIQQALTTYGYEIKASRHKISVRLPCYRSDLMHPVDVAEDVAISRGYESFAPIMPSQFTVGSLSEIETMSDFIRDQMIGQGFQEIFSNILMSHEDLVERMRIRDPDHTGVVEVDNVMSQSFSCLRSWILPSLLRVETASPRAFYPHRLFEIGEVAIPDLSHQSGSRTLVRLGAFIAHPNANFSEAHTCLDWLLHYLVREYTLEPSNHGTFLEGRVGKIMCGGQAVGLIGELHPEVLETWQITMPVSAFELDVDALLL